MRRRAYALLVLLVAVLVALNVFVPRFVTEWDLTAERSATLSDETKRVLREIDGRIEVIAFFSRDSVGRVEAATLLSRYRDENRRISYRILDPAQAPGEARRLRIEQTGSAAVRDPDEPDEVEIAQYTIEIDITSAIARLVRDVQGTVCFATGHGERDIEDQSGSGLADAVDLLEENGYKTQALDLLTRDSIPSGCAALVVASPTTRLTSDGIDAVVTYLRRGGKAWVLSDPSSRIDLSRLTRPWAIRFLRGLVLEADERSHLPGDVTSPIVRRYSGDSPVVRGLGPTFFPNSQGVDVLRSDDAGLTTAEIASSSELAYLDRDDVSKFDPKVDIKGPVALGASADDSEVERPGTERARIRRTRVLAWGDVDFATNAFLNDGSNSRLFVQGVDWLTQPESLVTAVPRFPQVRQLELTQARNRYILFLMAGVVPGLFVIAGALVWVLRRSR